VDRVSATLLRMGWNGSASRRMDGREALKCETNERWQGFDPSDQNIERYWSFGVCGGRYLVDACVDVLAFRTQVLETNGAARL
jgi:hypothetical protein